MPDEPKDLLTSLLFSPIIFESNDVSPLFLSDVSGSKNNQSLDSNESIPTSKSSTPAQANIGLSSNQSGTGKGSSLAYGVQPGKGYTPQDLLDMYKAGVNAVRELDNKGDAVSKSWDPLTLVKLILEIVLPMQEKRKREIDRTFEMIKTMNQNDPSNKDALDLIIRVREKFIDVNKRHEIELVKIKSDNDLKYQELHLQLLEMKMKHEKNMTIMDLIISLLTSALQIISPFLENMQSAYPKQPHTIEKETIKVKMKSPTPVEDEQIPPIPIPVTHGSRA